MKTYGEQTRSIRAKLEMQKIHHKKNKSIAAASVWCCVALVIGLFLFVPYNDQYVFVGKYAGSEYYPLIKAVSEVKNNAAAKKSNFERWFGGNGGADWFDGSTSEMKDLMTGGGINVGSSNGTDASFITNSPSYEEITDNQEQGVTEADCIKRSDQYIYYLRDKSLTIYSIEGEGSHPLGSYTLEADPGFEIMSPSFAYDVEMYLSQDCSTVTVIAECFKDHKRYNYIISLDVSDPLNIHLNGRMYLSGGYLSSRLIDGKLYLFTRWSCGTTPDYSDPSTFLPRYGTAENMKYISMEDIIIPEDSDHTGYTVVSRLDEKTLAMEDTAALLSYSGKVYVSENNIFLTRGFTGKLNSGNNSIYCDKTEICQISYTGDTLEHKGSFIVDGTVENQYSMDEHDGFLRVVTSTESYTLKKYRVSGYTWASRSETSVNASLYCIDLSDYSVRASVENFAPEGESVRSVRFDSESAYVCTSIVLKDPVFFFDLSDLDNITYKDTGTIDGYSMSLIDFTDGFLMGIGYGNSFNTLKIEIYREGENSVESHCKYELGSVGFSSEYKAYYIDRENQLIGLGLDLYAANENPSVYALLHFDGTELKELTTVPVEGNNAFKRAVYIDGYLYVFGDTFTVEKIT